MGGDGCAAGCLSVEFPYLCLTVGKPCTKSCGNGVFEGKDLSVGQAGTILTELCDDGNNLNNDGCSASCTVETGYTCVSKYLNLTYEIPLFYSLCTLTVPIPASTTIVP